MNSPNIIQAMRTLFRGHFKDLETWQSWQTFLKALFALPLIDEEVDLYKKCTGRDTAPTTPFQECWVPAGRRAGKSRIAAFIGVYLATCRNYSQFLARGERATVLVLAADRQQAQVVFRYLRDFLRTNPMLAALIETERSESIDLSNMVTLQVGTSSFRSIRGLTCAAIVCDEIAFWKDAADSANPAAEVLRALRPSLLTIPGSLLLAISSTFAEEGVLYDAVQRHYGVDDSDTLVWRAKSLLMNPTLDRGAIDRAMALDPDSARCEYDAEFRPGQESYISESALRACVVPGRSVIPANPMFRYEAFVDMSGGMNDSATIAIGHREGVKVIVDFTNSWPAPHNPNLVVEQMATFAYQAYGIRKVMGDGYGGGFVPGQWERHQVRYLGKAPAKSEIYASFVPLVMAGLVELPDDETLMRELRGLVRRNYAGGKFSIDHMNGRHDDMANSVCGLCVMLAKPRQICIIQQASY